MNPWSRLSDSPPFVLPEDVSAIERFNSSPSGREPHAIHVDVPPSPFTGSLDAPVVLLNLNPGYSDLHPQEFADDAYRCAVLANLRQDPLEHPFVVLDPRWEGSNAGHRWWNRKARWLIEEVGLDALTTALLVVEWFPYHSRRFRDLPELLPSQLFGFQIVEQAVQRGALVVAMRSSGKWKASVPSLVGHRRYFELRNVQNPMLSPANCPPGAFELLVTALRRG